MGPGKRLGARAQKSRHRTFSRRVALGEDSCVSLTARVIRDVGRVWFGALRGVCGVRGVERNFAELLRERYRAGTRGDSLTARRYSRRGVCRFSTARVPFRSICGASSGGRIAFFFESFARVSRRLGAYVRDLCISRHRGAGFADSPAVVSSNQSCVPSIRCAVQPTARPSFAAHLLSMRSFSPNRRLARLFACSPSSAMAQPPPHRAHATRTRIVRGDRSRYPARLRRVRARSRIDVVRSNRARRP